MEKRIAIKDANILFDLINGDLLGHWVGLGIETWIAEPVFAEVVDCAQREILTGCIERHEILVETIPDEEALSWLESVKNLAKKNNLSFADAAALHCAETKKAILLTGDLKLRKAACRSDIEVRGVLWVLDQLIENQIIGCDIAYTSLTAILAEGARLPKTECNKRLENWSSSADWADL